MRNKYSIIGIAFIFAFLLAEALLRSFTDFPVSDDNRIIDKDIGYRVSPHLRDVDIYGFRNRDDKWNIIWYPNCNKAECNNINSIFFNFF